MNKEEAVLVIIDIQGKLAHLMHEAKRMHQGIIKTVEVARLFDIPILWTEQAPAKIGSTIPEIAHVLSDKIPIAKYSFSCYGSAEFVNQLQLLNRKQIIIVGIETHVCIFQTVRDLMQHGYSVELVADAISARSEFQHHVGMNRMQQEGAVITSTEMLFCDLLKTAEDARFKQVMDIYKR